MSTFTSTSASIVRPVSPRVGAHRGTSYVIALVAVAAATIIAVVSIGLWWPTSDSASTSTRTVQSTTAAELTTSQPSFAHTGAPARRATTPAIVRSANAAEQLAPSVPAIVQSTNATEQPAPSAPAIVQSTNATEQPAPSVPAIVQSTNATEQPALSAPAIVQSTNATEQGVPSPTAAVQSANAAEQGL
jgi:hypothetical protein